MAGKIFISYRRDDVPGDARGVRDSLTAKFGKSNVFMDIDNLLAGQRFDVELAKALDSCDVLVAIIGPRWMDLLRQRTSGGDRDYVCEEIAAALRRNIVVIPVRVGREGVMPTLPRTDELPDDIRDLVQHQKLDIAHERFGRDVAELVESVGAVIAPTKHKQSEGVKVWGFTLAAIVVVASTITYAVNVTVPPSNQRTAATSTQTLVPSAKSTFPEIQTRTETFKDCNDGCPEMVVIPAGSFVMGSTEVDQEKPPHPVTFRQSFAIGKYEVTFAEWEACVRGGGCVGNKTPNDYGWGKGRRPVINVSATDAKEYLTWLSRKTGKSYRLLTEAEWEYAARAGSTSAFPWGNEVGNGNANCHGCGISNQQSTPVGSFRANGFGLYDMHGNVME